MEIVVATLVGVLVGVIVSFISGPLAGFGIFLVMEFGVLFAIIE
jgi:hypothetical protein